MTRLRTSTPRKIARKMLRIFDGKRERWTKGELARSTTSQRVRPESPSACRWCIVGALRKACVGLDDRSFADAYAAIANRRRTCIEIWNDTRGRTFNDVVKLLTEVAEAQP